MIRIKNSAEDFGKVDLFLLVLWLFPYFPK